MSSRCRDLAVRLVFVLAVTGTLSACDREQRQFPDASQGAVSGTSARVSELQPGQPQPDGKGASALEPLPPNYWKDYEGNAFAVSQGKRLYRWYNCSGCHAAGGGSIGPPLMDSEWRYGGEPQQIFATIKDGRPNGMPSFAGHITDDQLWQIVAYVRSMSGQLRTDVAPNRSDSLQPHEPESRRPQEDMKQTGAAPGP